MISASPRLRVSASLLLLAATATAQTQTAGKVTIAGTAQATSHAPAPFNILTPTSSALSPTNALFPGFPTVSGHLAVGYQGGLYINGLALYDPWQWQTTVKQGTLLAYSGGASGTFACTTSTSCAA